MAEALYSDTEAVSVLDIGCGIGRLAGVFIELGSNYVGIDLSPEAIEDARKNCPAGEFHACNLLEYQPQQTFDFILCAWVLVHFVDDQDLAAMLDLIAECSKTGSLFCLIDVMSDEPTSTAPHFLNRSIKEYRDALTRRGFIYQPDLIENIKRDNAQTPAIRHLYLFRRI